MGAAAAGGRVPACPLRDYKVQTWTRTRRLPPRRSFALWVAFRLWETEFHLQMPLHTHFCRLYACYRARDRHLERVCFPQC